MTSNMSQQSPSQDTTSSQLAVYRGVTNRQGQQEQSREDTTSSTPRRRRRRDDEEDTTIPISLVVTPRLRFLKTIILSHGLQILRESAFNRCEVLEKIYIPSTVTEIQAWCFAKCYRLPFVQLPNSVRIIGEGAFSRCKNLKSVQIPPKVSIVQDRTFENCQFLGTVEIHENLESIGSSAFKNCKDLRNIFLPRSVQHIGHLPFEGCDDLYEVVVPDTDDTLIVALQRRFSGLPIHSLIYFQGYHPPVETMEQLRKLRVKKGDGIFGRIDRFGMKPLHLLASSTKPNLDICKALVVQGSSIQSTLKVKDNWGLFPLQYASCNFAPNSVASIKYLLKVTYSYEVKSLGLQLWRDTVLNEIDGVGGVYDFLCDRPRIVQLQRVCQAFFKYCMKEQLSLLELAIWKAKLHQQSKPKSISRLNLLSCFNPPRKKAKLCQSDDPSEMRAYCRMFCGADVIISNVIPFLEGWVNGTTGTVHVNESRT